MNGKCVDGYAYGGDSLAWRLGTWKRHFAEKPYCACGEYSLHKIEGWGWMCENCLQELATWPDYEWLRRQGIVK